jgi:hypothetical protein
MVTARVLASCVALVLVACSGDDSNAIPPDDAGGSDAPSFDARGAPEASPFDGGATDAAADAPAEIDSGDRDAGRRTPGGRGLVSGGAVSHSASFTLVGAIGQSPGGNNASASQSYRLRGGVVGVTQGR